MALSELSLHPSAAHANQPAAGVLAWALFGRNVWRVYALQVRVSMKI